MSANAALPLGTLIRSFRQRAGLTIEELAEASEVSPRAVSDIERGLRQTPHRKTIVAISRGLNLKTEESSELARTFRSTRVQPAQLRHGALPLPRISSDIVGRSAQLKRLHETFLSRKEASVAVVSGAPGIGKTLLAVTFARAVEAEFQRILFVDLGGSGDTPLSTIEVAQQLTNGLNPTSVPLSGEQVFDQLQKMLLEQKVLLVLDGVASEAQIRPLLPAYGPSAALLTSRLRLAGLLDVTHVALPALSSSESVKLLKQLLPSEPHDESLLRDLAALCSHVPLALRIAANQVCAFPDRTVAHVVARLERAEHRLDTLTAGDLSLQAACQTSYEQLDSTSQLVFRRLGIAETATLSVSIASLLTGIPELETRRALDRLTELSLIDPSGVDQYTAHELLWLFAKGCLEESESSEALQLVRANADRRILESTAIAGSLLTGDSTYLAPVWFKAPLFQGTSVEEAVVWLLEERAEWQGTLRRAAQRHEYMQFRAALYHLHWFSKVWHYQSPWAELFALGGGLAARLGHHADSCLFYGEQLWFLLVQQENQEHMESAAQFMEESAARTHDPSTLAWAGYYRAKLLTEQDRLQEALEHAAHSAYGQRAVTEPAVGVVARQQIAEILIRTGDINAAVDTLREIEALLMARRAEISPVGVTLAQANAARLLAKTNHHTGDWKATIAASTLALSTLEEFAYLPIHPLMTGILTSRAIAYEHHGLFDQAEADRNRVRALSELH